MAACTEASACYRLTLGILRATRKCRLEEFRASSGKDRSGVCPHGPIAELARECSARLQGCHPAEYRHRHSAPACVPAYCDHRRRHAAAKFEERKSWMSCGSGTGPVRPALLPRRCVTRTRDAGAARVDGARFRPGPADSVADGPAETSARSRKCRSRLRRRLHRRTDRRSAEGPRTGGSSAEEARSAEGRAVRRVER